MSTADEEKRETSTEELSEVYERAKAYGEAKKQEEAQIIEFKKQRIELRKKYWLQTLVPLYGLVIAYNIWKTDKENTKAIQFYIFMGLIITMLLTFTFVFWWKGTLICGILYIGLGAYIYMAIKEDRPLIYF